jgi:hypothetical protein
VAGEFEIGDQTYDNVANVNFKPFTCVDIDVSNSGAIVTAVLQATTATEVLGVCYDQSHLNPDGTVTSGSAVAVRTFGIAKCLAHAAITVGAYVSVGFTDGSVAAKTQAAAGAQPGAIVGRALNSASGIGDTILVLLMIGARY